MGLTEADIDEGFIAEARAVLATGTHLSHPRTEAAVLKALDPRPQARRAHRARHRLPPEPLGRRRPRRGREPLRRERRGHRGSCRRRCTSSTSSSAPRRSSTSPAARPTRSRRCARCARSPTRRWSASAARAGAVAFDRRDPGEPRRRPDRPRLPDRGLQRARRRRRLLLRPAQGLADRRRTGRRALKYANACGAFAVSRHGCTPAYPSLAELDFFLGRGVVRPDLRNDQRARADPLVDQPSASTAATGRRCGSSPSTTACSSRRWTGATPEKIGAFKQLCLRGGARRCADGRPGYGILCDNRLGRAALHAASGTGLWIGRPCEWPGSRPLTLEPELGSRLRRPRRMGAGGRGQGAVLLPPGRHAGDARPSRRRR